MKIPIQIIDCPESQSRRFPETVVCFTTPAVVVDRNAFTHSKQDDGGADQAWFNVFPWKAFRVRPATLLEHDSFELAQGTQVLVALARDGSHVRLFVPPRLTSGNAG